MASGYVSGQARTVQRARHDLAGHRQRRRSARRRRTTTMPVASSRTVRARSTCTAGWLTWVPVNTFGKTRRNSGVETRAAPGRRAARRRARRPGRPACRRRRTGRCRPPRASPRSPCRAPSSSSTYGIGRNSGSSRSDRQVVAHLALAASAIRLARSLTTRVEPGRRARPANQRASPVAVVCPADVDAARAGRRVMRSHGRRRVAHRQAELARDVVAGAGRDDAERHPRAGAQVGAEVDHAVTAGDHDAVDRTRGDGCPALLHRTAGVGRAEVEDVDARRPAAG